MKMTRETRRRLSATISIGDALTRQENRLPAWRLTWEYSDNKAGFVANPDCTFSLAYIIERQA